MHYLMVAQSCCQSNRFELLNGWIHRVFLLLMDGLKMGTSVKSPIPARFSLVLRLMPDLLALHPTRVFVRLENGQLLNYICEPACVRAYPQGSYMSAMEVDSL